MNTDLESAFWLTRAFVPEARLWLDGAPYLDSRRNLWFFAQEPHSVRDLSDDLLRRRGIDCPAAGTGRGAERTSEARASERESVKEREDIMVKARDESRIVVVRSLRGFMCLCGRTGNGEEAGIEEIERRRILRI